ncbi:SusC/RagA family TonB-linked outer membrane protein [Bacteroides salyersiae]|nr:TonB-dependent receptor [Bacteroides salyersiae]MBT9872308.1 SusC/RagA family TonB-linked outer membrane protein [Bacteroides salyersiae]QUT74296.1 TonB-dependent receptor P3 [Bacteroides salyersiae]
MKILPVLIRRRVIKIRFLNFLKKESHSFVLRGTVAMLFLFSTGILYAQKVSVRYKDVPLKNVLSDVAKQSKLRLAYSGSFTDLSVKVSVQASGKDVKEVLSELSQKTNVNFEVRNGSIYIYIKEPPQKEKKEKASFLLSGTVYDENNLPLIGVNVLIKGTTKGTSSNMDGEFTITVEKGNILVFSYLGYTSKELTVKNKEPMRIVMSEDAKVLSEVVVIGYGAVRKTDVTGAISSIKMDDLSITTPTLEQALVGHAAGVEIKQTSGSPGEGLSLRVRGVSSINAGSEPLYVVDGFPASKDVYINPNDVASIEVLKDAASAAIYGSRAAGGVVLITTKRGTNSGRAKVEYDFQYGFQQVDHKIKMLDAYGMRDLSIECANNAYRDWCTKNGKEYNPLHNNEYRMSVAGATSGKIFQIPDIFFDFTTGKPVEPAYNTDWQDAIFSTAPIMKHNLNITGGSDRIRYMASAGYMEQDGIIAPSYHHRFTTRFNIDGKLTDRLSIGVNTSASYTKNRIVQAEGRHYNDGIIMSALVMFPQFPVYNTDGSYAVDQQMQYAKKYSIAPAENPVALAHEIEDYQKRYMSSVSGYLELEVIKGLKAKVYSGMQYISQTESYYRPSTVGGTIMNTDGTTAGSGYVGDQRLSRASYSTQTNLDWILEATLNYNRTFGDHGINILAGYSMQEKVYDNSSIGARNFVDDTIRELSAHGTAPGDSWGDTDKFDWAMMSVFGRVVYSWKDRYTFTGSLRGDGSSRFGKDNRWGIFPSVALGWNLSNEEFWTNHIGENFGAKLRASWGISGNNNIGNYEHVGYMSNLGGYVLGGQIVPTRYPSAFVDNLLGWEKTDQYNVGMDLSFLRNRLTLSANYYKSISNDLLFNKPISAIAGATQYKSNLSNAKIRNTGFDIQVDGRILTGPVTWNVGANLSLNRNKVLSLPDSQSIVSIGERSAISHITMVGKPIGSFYGLNSLGVISEEEYQRILVDKQHIGEKGYQLTGPAVWNYENVQPGDAKWKDVNNDGKITDDDREILGDNYPDFTYGFSTNISYKGVSLSASFSGVQGAQVISFQNYYLLNMEGTCNQFALAADRYNSVTNPDPAMYRANIATTNKNTYGVSSYMINDASYFRCTNITLNYNLPQKWVEKIKLRGVSLFASVDNAFTITDYIGYNPDVSYKSGNLMPGFDWGTYPLSRAYNFGCKLSF